MPTRTPALGVSIVICCHNSASRLPTTLQHLACQDSVTVPWEVIVVDNGSTDSTAQTALTLWPASSVPLRVIREERLGLAHARVRGFSEAHFEIVSFIDDDNWVAQDWVKLVSDIFSNNLEIGALNGINHPAPEHTPPSWLPMCYGIMAISHPDWKFGDVTKEFQMFGAGLSVRMQAWSELRDTGFTFSLSGRRGTSLASGEDTELCAAIATRGWKLWRDPRLNLWHFLPKSRLNWRYCRRLMRGIGAGGPLMDCYVLAKSPVPQNLMARLRETWVIWVYYALSRILSDPLRLAKMQFFLLEGDEKVLRLEERIGRVKALLSLRRRYNQRITEIRMIQSISGRSAR